MKKLLFLTNAVFRLEYKVDRIINLLEAARQREIRTMATLDDVVTKVTALKSVDDSVVTLLQQLKAQLDAALATGDLAKVQAIADAIDAEASRLASAVIANTPAAPPTP